MRLEPHRLIFIDETAVTTKMTQCPLCGQSELSLQVRNQVRLKSRAVTKGGLRTFAAPAN
jgi:hypothetical protein